MEEWDHTAKQLKINAELLESVCKDKLTHLHQEKQKARKAYQEEHSKIAAQFNNVSSLILFHTHTSHVRSVHNSKINVIHTSAAAHSNCPSFRTCAHVSKESRKWFFVARKRK